MAGLMDLAQPTISRIVSNLVDKGLLRLGDRLAQGRGQPSPELVLQPGFAYGIGVSLLGDSVSLDVVDFGGNIVWRGSAAIPGMRQKDVVDQLRAFKHAMLSETGLEEARLAAAGVGVSAFFVGDGALMNPPALLDDWALMDIAPIIAGALGVPAFVDNDGNVACVGESMYGVGRRIRNFAYFQITNGFGGGVVINGQPHRGTHGNAGEFAALWQCMGIEHPNLERLRLLLGAHGRDFQGVSEMLADPPSLDHPGVEAWLDEAGPAFSLAATAATAVLDCEAIVLGGRLPGFLADALASRILIAHTTRRDRPLPRPVVVPSEVTGGAVSVGAAALALQQLYFS